MSEATPAQLVWAKLKRSRPALLGAALLALFFFTALFAPWLAPDGPDDQDLHRRFQAPGFSSVEGHFPFLLGTDNVGRDLLSRVILGARISLRVGFFAVAISAVFGILLGAVAGYFGGVTESVIMRCMDIMLAFPSILLAIAIVTVLGNSLTNAMIAVGIVGIPVFARLTRAAVLGVKSMDYVEAARAQGASHARVLFVHVLPNCVNALIVQATLSTGTAVLDAAGLSFLGLGAKPPAPEWGTMLSDTFRYYESAPWCVVAPGLAIMGMVLGFNLLGDGLRDALDPRLKED